MVYFHFQSSHNHEAIYLVFHKANMRNQLTIHVDAIIKMSDGSL